MATYKFSNNAHSNLASEIGTGDITLSVTTGEGSLFPSLSTDEVFDLYVFEGSDSEWMLATARAGDTITVTRSDSPKAFTTAATIEHRLSANALNQMWQKGADRTVTTDPDDDDLAALHNGEEVLNTVTGVYWKHITGTTWKEMNES